MVHLRVASGTGSSSSATGASKGTLSPKLRGKTPLSSPTAAATASGSVATQKDQIALIFLKSTTIHSDPNFGGKNVLRNSFDNPFIKDQQK